MTTYDSTKTLFLTLEQHSKLCHVASFLSQFLLLVDEHQELNLSAVEVTSVVLPLSNSLDDVLLSLNLQLE